MSETPDRLPGLQALRLAAAAVVFVLHAVYFSPDLAPAVLEVANAYFRLGVQLFFVVSAFALMHSTRVYETAPDWVGRFYLKRFWRIAPLFYLMAAITPFYSYYANSMVTTPTEVALNLLFLNNLVPQYSLSLVYAGWSVSVEVLFYCAFPLAFATIRTLRAGALLLIASIIIGEAARASFTQIRLLVGNYGDFNVLVHLPYFAFGIVAFLAYDKLRRTRWGAADAPAIGSPKPKSDATPDGVHAASATGMPSDRPSAAAAWAVVARTALACAGPSRDGVTSIVSGKNGPSA